MKSRDYIKEFRRLIWERGERSCGICTLPLELSEVHIDHIVPIISGGADS
jgi:5-methylcytosine-specific restriction endonuclease McrA